MRTESNAVELATYRPEWVLEARAESERLGVALGPILLTVHHIGSTSIPGIRAKPILDLIPVYRTLAEADRARPILEDLGYRWRGEFGLVGRRYCTLDDPRSGKRMIQLHGYKQGDPEIDRHLAFRDYLRARPDLATEYEAEKTRCRDRHPPDSQAYNACKDAWIKRVEAEALISYRRAGQ